MRVFLPIVLFSTSFATPVILTLNSTEGENVITIKATVNDTLSDTSTTTYSGTIETDLTISGTSVTNFEMTGGKIFTTDATFLFEIPNFFSQTVTFQSLTATPVSPNGPETLSLPDQFTASQHYFLFNQGCVVSVGSFGDSKSLVAEDPFSAAGSTIGTITSASPQEIRSSITNDLIATSRLIELVLPLDSTTTSEDQGNTLTTETTGTVTASGTLLEFTHPFFEWATMNAPLAGNALAFTSDADHDGQQDGIAWALGFAPGTPAHLLQTAYNSTTGNLAFLLPGSTRALLSLERSTSLSPGDWTPVTGFSAIPIGTTGPLTLPIESGLTAFYRFTATLD